MTPRPLHYATPSPGPRRPTVRWIIMVAIMSVLVGGWRVYARRYAREVNRRNSVRVTAAIVGFLEARLNEFASDVGRFPTTAEGLDALVRQPPGLPGWKGPYVKSPAPDVWGNPYTYTETGGAYRVGSLGPTTSSVPARRQARRNVRRHD